MEYELGEIEPFYFFSKIKFYKNEFDSFKIDIRNKFFPQFFSRLN
ncbi:hypothetical protein LEP1GSC021_1030 [Leptospira noguchii str. 1993005606]|uniref:Uncharacterized protein n=3 Tax=Leptospira noguchii TaxID=28182 RepID=M6YA53_9LEPT|nr:hypothetical protein LEP1GSC041_2992 [Leptospira noguchii str. 2006001870]EMN01545.1 hypothetical protein LEP1GSC035_4459 [Leptospira noguchii str. 2007001578]EMO27576.1 hypothetical protein LEP1GSC170_0779 [Leptospira interrogans serovar Bataviae str. HAI135]EMO40753.1 hypothetical protein LEP1GSC186_0648 [Leptospira noguchii serovar Autumnalis str. ZUN142]EMO91227.1 hypothetical protein LEP1GSC024_0219 [Leptospira noguchii str. 2001034031]EMS85429.1 hypothetical protein LEP1GSC074_1773 [L